MKWIKKAICISLVMLMFLTASSFAKAEPIKIFINKEIVPSDQAPIIKNSRVLVPIRVVSENLGASVSYDAKEKRVNIKKGEISMTLVIGDDMIWYSDMDKAGPVDIDVPAMIKNGRTMVPLRAIAELFDMKVKWDSKKRSVYIDNKVITTMINVNNAGVRVMDALKQKGSLPDGTYVVEVKPDELDFDGAKLQGYAITLRRDNPNDSTLSELVGHYFIDKTGTLVLHYDVVTDFYTDISVE